LLQRELRYLRPIRRDVHRDVLRAGRRPAMRTNDLSRRASLLQRELRHLHPVGRNVPDDRLPELRLFRRIAAYPAGGVGAKAGSSSLSASVTACS
jgi:hypothetical protein